MPGPRLDAGVAILRDRYRVQVEPGVLTRTGYLAGDDARRADALNQCLRDPDVRAIVLARGGYGIMRILDQLDADALRRDPKLIVGFSDATALLAWVHVVAGLCAIHGPMVTQLGDLPGEDVQWLFQLMEGATPTGPLALSLTPIGARTGGEPICGRLMGGNLCLLSHLVGTPYWPAFDDALLVVEDVGERPYRIDRYLTHLGLAGCWGAGALIGDLTRCEETDATDHPAALDVVDERLARAGVPGLAGLPVGHGARNLALPMGARAALDQARGQLHLLQSASVT